MRRARLLFATFYRLGRAFSKPREIGRAEFTEMVEAAFICHVDDPDGFIGREEERPYLFEPQPLEEGAGVVPCALRKAYCKALMDIPAARLI